MASEIAELTELLTKKGITRDEVHREVTGAIRDAYKLWSHTDDEVQVSVEYTTDEIHIYKADHEVTPEGFSQKAQEVARKALIKMLSRSSSANWLVQLLFWFYNGIYFLFFAIFVIYIIQNSITGDLTDIFLGLKSYQAVMVSILIITPFIATALAVKQKLQKNSQLLAKVFFLFEIPVITLCLFSVISLSNVIASVWVIFLILLLLPFYGLLTFLKIPTKNNTSTQLLSFVVRLLILGVTAYIGLMVAFFIPALIAALMKTIWQVVDSVVTQAFRYGSFLELIPLTIITLFGSLLVITGALVILLPYIVSYFLAKSVRASWYELLPKMGKKTLIGSIAATYILLIFVVLFSSWQGTVTPLLTSLEKIQEKTTFEDREKIAERLFPQEKKVTQAITDGQNAYARYLFVKEDESVAQMYAEIFNQSSDTFILLQGMFNLVAYPFMYNGPRIEYNSPLYMNYQYVYGKDIDGYDSSNYTYKAVKLKKREVTTTSVAHNLFAKITITEEYQNETYSNQEVLYEFSLPNNSVVTDLKLGANLENEGIIAPRGAAWRIYQGELNKQRDPALLEQTGPREYRLRVFPIPSKIVGTKREDNLKAQFTYLTPLTSQGYALPAYTLEQNIDTKTAVHTGTRDQKTIPLNADTKIIPRDDAQNILCSTGTSQIAIKTASTSATLQLTKGNCPDQKLQVVGKNIAIYYDVSAKRKDSTQWEQITKLQKEEIIKNNTVDLYLFNDLVGEKTTLTPTEALTHPIYFGTQHAQNLLAVVPAIYDTVIILSNKDFPLHEGTIFFKDPQKTKRTIYIISDDQKYPALTQSHINDLYQSNYNFVDSITEALLIDQKTKDRDPARPVIATTPYWTLTQGEINEVAEVSTDEDLKAFLAAKDIENQMRIYIGSLDQNRALADTLYREGQQDHIVTPLSSLIALVNETQKQNLIYESEKFDKYTDNNTPPGTSGSIRLPINTQFGFTTSPFSSSLGQSLDVSAPNGSSPYGFTSMGNAYSSIFNLFIFANAIIIGLAAITFGIKYLKQRRMIRN